MCYMETLLEPVVSLILGVFILYQLCLINKATSIKAALAGCIVMAIVFITSDPKLVEQRQQKYKADHSIFWTETR